MDFIHPQSIMLALPSTDAERARFVEMLKSEPDFNPKVAVEVLTKLAKTIEKI